MRIFLALYVFTVVAAVSILGFRGSISTKPPLEVFPDMDRQARYKPQAENEFFADGRNDRPVPANTVARGNYFNQAEVFSAGFEDHALGDTVLNDGKDGAGNFVKTLPLEVSHALMAEGKEKYDIFCTVCHGAAGDGNGVTKPYGVLAASYHDDRLRSVEDGYIFDVIKNGKGLMLPLNDRISPEEGWAIVLYVRALQRSQNADAKELSAAQRTELGF
ncbi:cytochrome c [Opitutales bacterium]|jgi:mono/diheme cytochrome c family protein|nr:cytochrome c [Opitutales bacterium]MDB2682368.1 cytochrome c [Opitutales bacterium]